MTMAHGCAGLINALSSSTQSGHPAFQALCDIASLSYSLGAPYYSLTPSDYCKENSEITYKLVFITIKIIEFTISALVKML